MLDRRQCDDWLSRHEGVVRVSDLIRFGDGPATVRARVRRGEFRRIFPGVLIANSAAPTANQQLVAMCLAHPLVAVAFTTAGRHWGFRRMQDPVLHVLAPHQSRVNLPGVQVHRCRRIDPVDIVELPNGMRVTSPARTVFDAAELLGVEATESVVEQVLNERRLTLRTLLDTLERLGHPRRPGTTNLHAALRGRPAWRRAIQSDLEHKFLAAVRAAGLPEPEVQHRLTVDGRSITLDLAWPHWLVGAEIDHHHWHASREQATADRARDRLSMIAGWRVVRITDDDILFRLDEVLSDLAAVLHQAGCPL